MRPFLLVPLLVVLGCRAEPDPNGSKAPDTAGGSDDADGDGFGADDCDDNDDNVNPAAPEACNGLDDNCDGVVDEGVESTWYADADGDGFGDAALPRDACELPTGHVVNADDCDDNDPAVHPAAEEACNDLDDDCDGDVDEGLRLTYYADADADGYGAASAPLPACEQPSGYVEDNTDCDDATASAWPGAEEVCDRVDNDCDGDVDEGVLTTWSLDLDADGWGDGETLEEDCSQPTGYGPDGDCDDDDPSVHPDAAEVCNGADDDCDGDLDEGFDADSDGVADCDDTEVCDGLDNDGDGAVDENDAADATTWSIDYDGDGYGSSRYTVTMCEQPAGYVADDTDCDDADAGVNPGAAETCDGTDEDCDGAVDDGVTLSTWYADNDGDGYGDTSTSITDCTAPAGYVTDGTDCDDSNAAVNPAATETCDGTDEDCDGTVDDGLTVSTWYADNDGDGYGDTSTSVSNCVSPTGYVSNNADCDDTDASVQACASCLDVLDAGRSSGDGAYELDPCGTGPAEYWCDMSTDGGGWTLAGWQAADGTDALGLADWGTLGGTEFSTSLACVPYEEVMVFNQTYGLWVSDTYTASTFAETADEFTLGASTDAFVQGWYGPSTSLYTMACVNFYAVYGAPAYGCDNDWYGGQQGHVTDYAGEFCSGGRLDGTWAWADGSSCLYRGTMYTWGWALR